MGFLSVIIPAYNEELMIARAEAAIAEVLNKAGIEYEIIFVDDGSKDTTWYEIQSISNIKNNVYGLHFSRNFGKEAAIMAGLNAANGECSVVIDCDLQMPPETIVEMYALWKQGYEVIEGVKNSRGKESFAYEVATGTFYKLISKATGFDMENSSDFKLLDKKAVNVLINMNEKNAFFRALSSWIGFNTTYVTFDVREREVGTSKWCKTALFKYAMSNIASFSTVPMQLVTVLGAIMLIISVIFSMISFIQKINGIGLPGFTTVILLLLFSSSIIMISLGIMGYYIACIYEEIKGRPRYIISSTCGRHEES